MRRNLPGFAQLAGLNIGTKLGLIVLVLALPIVALLFVQYENQQSTASQSSSESHGLDYISTVMPFLQQVQIHRGLAERVMNGDEGARAAMDKAAATADDALAAINASDKKWGGDFKTKDYVAFLNAEWPKARDARSSTQESATLHNSVITQGVFPLIQNVSVQSKLAVDPDLDSRNVIEALTVTLPHLTESLSQMRANGGGALAARKNQPATDETRQQLSGFMNVAAFQADTLTQQLEVAMNKNSRFESDLRPILTRANTSRGVFFDNTRDNILNAQALAPGGADIYFLLGGSAIDLSNQLLTSAQQTLNAEFQDRADAARSDFAMQGTAAGIGIILALGLALFMSASITRPMTHLAEVADRMSLGELDVDIDVEGKNEIGQLAESLRRMQASLRSAIERLRQRRAA
jgi:HAMP domain-containing protein